MQGSRTRYSSSARLPQKIGEESYLVVWSRVVSQWITLPAAASPSGFVELAAGVLALAVHSCEGAVEWVSTIVVANKLVPGNRGILTSQGRE